jgi:arylsulfatase A-like enzyme
MGVSRKVAREFLLAHTEVCLKMRRDTGERVGVFTIATGLALFFLYLELLKSQRASQWSGILPADWPGILVVFAIYTLVLGAVVWVLGSLARRLPCCDCRSPQGLAVLFPAAGAVLWVLLSVHREFAPTVDDVLVGAVLVGVGVAIALGGLRAWWSPRRFGALLIFVWLSGLSALIAAGEFALFRTDRAGFVTIYPGAWLCFSAIVLAGLAFAGRFRTLAAGGVVLAIIPPLAAACALYAPAPSGERPPNLVFLISDTLRADYCRVYGGAVPTPNLERLAARGTRFDRHYSLAPWTLPSMTGLFSGQYPKSLTPDAGHERWTLEMNMYEVDRGASTLPERAAAAGYVTGAFTANAFLPVVPGMMLGYQERASSHPILLRDEGLLRQAPFLGALSRSWFPALADIRPHNTTIALDHYARAFIRRHRNEPFFLWIHYIDPHAPYDPPASMRRIEEGPWPFFHPYVGGEAWGIPILGKDFAVEEAHRAYVQSLYEGEVAYIDAFTGRVMDALEEAGVEGDTYFCFTSDHGEELWDHGDWGHGQSLHEEQVRVPLILAGPGILPRVEPAPVSAIDLLPTLAELLSLTPSPAWLGESLVPVLRGEVIRSPKIPVFAAGTSNKSPNPQYMVVRGNHKLVVTAGSAEVALYDLATDPGERRNFAGEYPERVRELREVLDTWRAAHPGSFSAGDGAVPEFNRELEQGLDGMGYF